MAVRLKANLEARLADQARQAEADNARIKTLSVERERLFVDLNEFGQAVGHIVVKASGSAVIFRYEGREVRFDAKGKGDRVDVSGSDIPKKTQLFVQAELNACVVKGPNGAGKEEQELLFDKGLARLINIGLGLQ